MTPATGRGQVAIGRSIGLPAMSPAIPEARGLSGHPREDAAEERVHARVGAREGPATGRNADGADRNAPLDADAAGATAAIHVAHEGWGAEVEHHVAHAGVVARLDCPDQVLVPRALEPGTPGHFRALLDRLVEPLLHLCAVEADGVRRGATRPQAIILKKIVRGDMLAIGAHGLAVVLPGRPARVEHAILKVLDLLHRGLGSHGLRARHPPRPLLRLLKLAHDPLSVDATQEFVVDDFGGRRLSDGPSTERLRRGNFSPRRHGAWLGGP